MKTASIIITCFNKELYIKDSIESAINQKFNDYEILIIDDGSTDNSLEIINSFKNEKLIRIISQKNIGIVGTRNKAIKNANGKYIVQLDGDDILGENFLSSTVPVLNENINVGIVFCQTQLFGGENGIWHKGEYSLHNQLSGNLIPITALFRKEDFLKTNGYDVEFDKGLEDWDLWLSIIELGYIAIELDAVEFYYRIIENSRNSNYNVGEQNKKIYIKHLKLYVEHFIDPIALSYMNKIKDHEIASLETKLNSFEHRLIEKIFKPLRKVIGK